MGAPIVIPQRRNIWESLLPQMFFMKIKHNMDMDVLEAETKLETVKLKEKRGYQEKTQLGKEKRGEATQIRKESRAKPMLYNLDGEKFALTGGKLTRIQSKSQKVWSKKDQSYVFRTPGQIARDPDAYGRTGETVLKQRRAGAPKISIGAKQKQKDVAYLTGPKFMTDVEKDVANLNKGHWMFWDDREKQNAVRAAADKKIRAVHPNAKYGTVGGKRGWFTENEGGGFTMVAAHPLSKPLKSLPLLE